MKTARGVFAVVSMLVCGHCGARLALPDDQHLRYRYAREHGWRWTLDTGWLCQECGNSASAELPLDNGDKP